MDLICGDCLEVMEHIEPGSVDLILTDPPYGTIKGIGGSWTDDKTAWDIPIDHSKMLHLCNKVLRVNGALVLFGQDPYTGKLMSDVHGNLPFSYRLVWVKNTFANALIAKKAPVNYTEDICVFFKKYDTLNQHPLREYAKSIMDYCNKTSEQFNKELGHRRAEHFFYVDSTQFGLCTEPTYNQIIKKYNLTAMPGFKCFQEMEQVDGASKRSFSRCFNLPDGKKHKSNVLEYKKDYPSLHPTQKPVALMKNLIKTYTDEGDMVLDFCMGSGTTIIAADYLGRESIGIEKNKKYFKIAKERIEKAKLNLFSLNRIKF